VSFFRSLEFSEQEWAHRFYRKIGSHPLGLRTARLGRADLIFLFQNRDGLAERIQDRQ
jgi:hypothetical protein